MRKDCPRFLKALVQKLQEISPLKYSFISYQKYHMFIMVTEPEAAKLHFDTFVENLYSLNWMSDKSKEATKVQCDYFLSQECKKYYDKFPEFDWKV